MPGCDDADLVGEQHSPDSIAQAGRGEKVADVGLEPRSLGDTIEVGRL